MRCGGIQFTLQIINLFLVMESFIHYNIGSKIFGVVLLKVVGVAFTKRIIHFATSSKQSGKYMKLKLNIYDAKYPIPNYYAFDFVSEQGYKRLVVNTFMWMCLDVNNHYYSLDVVENIRIILKDSPARMISK